MKPTLRRLAALTLGAFALASCGTDQPTAVPRPEASAPGAPSASLLGALTSLLTVDGLQRTTLAIPEAGVTVVVPRGALAQTTTITMTARAGSLVAYDFAPHGITFAKPLVFSQQLRGTNASLLTAPLLQLGYYSDPSLLTKTGGLVSQLLGGTLNTLTWTFTAPIPHFSGYIVTCGRR